MMTPDNNSFGVMRLVLALAVLVSHSIYLTTGQGSLEPLYRWTNYTLGQHGVQVFFILSGVLVAQSLFRSGSIRDYATARALRIFPALIVCVLLTALVMGPLLTSLLPVTYLKDQGVAAYIAKTLTLWSGSAQLPGVFHENPVPHVVNTSVWTLKYEVLCYALLALAGAVVIKSGQWRAAAIASGLVWLAIVLYKPAGLELHGGAKSMPDVLRYFMIFFGTGVLFYALRAYIPVTVLLLVPLGGLFAYAIGGRFQEPAAALFLGYLALWLSTFQYGSLRDFTNQNDYSYATYLYHMPVAQVLLHLWPDMTALPLILATGGIVLWLAFFSWEFVERPALNLRHRLWKTTPHSAEAAFDAAMAAAKQSKVTAPVATPVADPVADAVAQAAAAKASLAARASERLVREMAAKKAAVAPAATEPTPVTAAPAEATPTEPGAAHVWRPMPTVKKLRIHNDDPSDQTEALEPKTSIPLDLIKKAASLRPGRSQPVEPVAAPPMASVPASRMALATKRPAVSELLQDTPVEPPKPVEPSRAVVAVPDEGEGDDLAAKPRVSQPRPNWSRPLGQGRPVPA